MRIKNSYFIIIKSVFYFIISLLLLFVKNSEITPLVAGLLFLAGAFSIVFGASNKDLESVSVRNYFNGAIEIITAILLFFYQSIPFQPSSILAGMFVVMAFAQLAYTLFASYPWVKSNTALNIGRLAAPLFSIIPAGLIMGDFISHKWGDIAEYQLLGVMFLVTALYNAYFISVQKTVDYKTGF